jgi:hypothetical protein
LLPLAFSSSQLPWAKIVTSTDGQDHSVMLNDSTRQFVLWVLEAIGLRVVSESDTVYRLEIPRQPDGSCDSAFESAESFDGYRFSWDQADCTPVEGSSPTHWMTWESGIGQWLLKELSDRSWPLNATVAHQPCSVHELAAHLFTQYQFPEGQIHLAGCSLEDRPFLRLTYLQPGSSSGGPQIFHCFAAADGQLVEGEFRESLDLENAIPYEGRAPRLDKNVMRQWVDVAAQRCREEQHFRDHADPQLAEPVAATLIWCKYAVGKLSFTAGQQAVELPFSGWAKFFCKRRIVPPPYTCPLTGKASYRLAVTDEGQITVAEGVGVCSESGERVLETDLVRCSVTDRPVLATYVENCPVCGQPVLRSELQRCEMCQQLVSPATVVGGRCAACRQLEYLSSEDSRWQRVVTRYPQLDEWGGWKISESSTVYILQGAKALQHMLVVLDRETLDVLRAATRVRWVKTWRPATADQQRRWLEPPA